jgi:uracil-DNA glycosylase
VRDNRLIDAGVCETDHLPFSWNSVLNQPMVKATLHDIKKQLTQRLKSGATIYPDDPWRALRYLPIEKVRVVILGQDPYHGPGQSHGLAFSVPSGCKTPPSLRHVLQEVARGEAEQNPHVLHAPQQTDLSAWVDQGVLLLNASLTVEEGQPASHAKMGWQYVTDTIIEAVAAQQHPIVFMLWGQHAQSKKHLIHNPDHLVLCANHPSPLSARRPPIPFLGCGHFVRANQWLQGQGKDNAIEWMP